jgi:hypothetical protein
MIRYHDVSRHTTAELQCARRELAASLALAGPGSPSAAPALAQIRAIDTELAERAAREQP